MVQSPPKPRKNSCRSAVTMSDTNFQSMRKALSQAFHLLEESRAAVMARDPDTVPAAIKLFAGSLHSVWMDNYYDSRDSRNLSNLSAGFAKLTELYPEESARFAQAAALLQPYHKELATIGRWVSTQKPYNATSSFILKM